MSDPKQTILVVDDNVQKRYSIVRYLRAAGFETIETASGEEALRLALNQPAVITLDINLPDVNGYEVARRLRGDERTAGIPIVHFSATFTTPNSRAQGLNSGGDTYLTGPVEPEELVATVNAAIRNRKAEAVAREFAAKWQATFDAIGDAVLLLNQDGRVERCNRAFCSLIKCRPEDVISHSLSEVAGPASVDQSVYFRMLGSRRRESIERCMNNVWYCISADPVLDEQGRFRGGVLIISDITDRKVAEEVREREQALLREQAEKLEAKVQERTRQLEESVHSMEGFCYTIAHDLRAPLRAVSGLTSALIEQYTPNLNETGRELADRITGAARRMDRLIEELLAFGRLSNSDLPRRTVDLESVFEGAVMQLHDEIQESNGIVTIDQPLPPVLANPTLVEQIALNLVGNALKFVAPEVQPRISVRAEERGSMVRLWVADNGIGIEPAYQKKIFGLFERLHSDKQYRGTGIGLAIVQKGAERMGGKVGVESEPGRGSRFWVELPKSP